MHFSSTIHTTRGSSRLRASKAGLSGAVTNYKFILSHISQRKHFNPSKLRIMHAMDVFQVAALDSAPEWTLDQIAGLVFASMLVALYFSSKLIDKYVASSQRNELGICWKCGGLNDPNDCKEQECPIRKV